MIGDLLALVLAAQPNIFEPKELSSEAIALGVEVCMSTLDKTPRAESLVLCGCVMDAVRMNTKAGMKPPSNGASASQRARCLALSRERRFGPDGGPTGS